MVSSYGNTQLWLIYHKHFIFLVNKTTIYTQKWQFFGSFYTVCFMSINCTLSYVSKDKVLIQKLIFEWYCLTVQTRYMVIAHPMKSRSICTSSNCRCLFFLQHVYIILGGVHILTSSHWYSQRCCFGFGQGISMSLWGIPHLIWCQCIL